MKIREVSTRVKLWNFFDESKISSGELTPFECEGIVDTGAIQMAIPQNIFNELKLIKSRKKVPVEYANGEIQEKEVALGLRVEIMERDTVVTAIIEPQGKEILIGMIVLEGLDLWVDSKNGKLIPNPESPDRPLYKMREER